RRPSPAGRYPLVLLLPGLDSTKEEFFHWENVFLTRGMATLSLDGPGQGETGERMSIRPDYEAAVTVVLDALRDRPALELRRVREAGPPHPLPAGRACGGRGAERHTGHVPGGKPRL